MLHNIIGDELHTGGKSREPPEMDQHIITRHKVGKVATILKSNFESPEQMNNMTLGRNHTHNLLVVG